MWGGLLNFLDLLSLLSFLDLFGLFSLLSLLSLLSFLGLLGQRCRIFLFPGKRPVLHKIEQNGVSEWNLRYIFFSTRLNADGK